MQLGQVDWNSLKPMQWQPSYLLPASCATRVIRQNSHEIMAVYSIAANGKEIA